MRTLWRVIILSVFLGLVSPMVCISQLGLNFRPVIVGQKPLTVNQGASITIQFSDLTVIDLDDPYPEGFTIKITDRSNYDVDGTTITPRADFTGILTVPITVDDGEDESRRFDLKITVIEVPNVPPNITSQVPLSVIQGESITLELSHLTVTDPDNNYPEDFSLSVSDGSNYNVSGRRITPTSSFIGTLTVRVRVNDGEDNSPFFDLSITVKAKNVAPVITGQAVLSTSMNTPITILLSHLTVTDPDNSYPNGFTLKVLSGPNYNVSGSTITPATNYVGELSVRVTVNDGIDESPVFNLKVGVARFNVAPIITGQVALSTNEETAITIQLTNLKVTDPDDKFPDNFTLKVNPGSNYTVAGNTVTPALNFTGSLQVGVSVNDGEANSNVFNLQILVNPVNDPPVITGQVPITINEDSNFSLLLSHLTVSDPDNTYPNGFTMQILPGANYTVDKNMIMPTPNYHGNLSVGITVSDGVSVSKQFNLVIVVNSINDAPEIIKLETSPGAYLLGKGPVAFSEHVEIVDPEQDSITYAELGFVENNYRQGSDELIYNNSKTTAIEGVFDINRGVLILIGKAKPSYYTDAIRAIQYNYKNADDSPLLDTAKHIYIYVSDGQAKSETKQRALTMISSIKLDIPNSFTPNGDTANDTWRIRSVNTADDYKDALVRVYNIRGMIVYEATGLDHEWDGNFKDSALPSDTYYYTINLNLNYTRATYQGIVTILR